MICRYCIPYKNLCFSESSDADSFSICIYPCTHCSAFKEVNGNDQQSKENGKAECNLIFFTADMQCAKHRTVYRQNAGDRQNGNIDGMKEHTLFRISSECHCSASRKIMFITVTSLCDGHLVRYPHSATPAETIAWVSPYIRCPNEISR